MRLIDADDLNKGMYHEAFETDSKLQKWDSGCWIRYKMFENHLKKAPSVDAVPVVHGRWIDEDFPDKPATYVTPAICSECGEMAHKIEHGYNILSKYCPNCGAKMDGNSE